MVCGSVSYAQDFSNKGKDFWVAYGYHQSMVGGGNSQDMVLYFAAEQVSNVTVSIPALGYSQTYVVPANTTIASLALPKAGALDCRLTAESTSPERKGIHITSDKPIVAYSHIYNSSVSGATILFPTATLGREYYSINFTNISNSANANCWFYVVAADTGTTTVEITPSALTSLARPAGVPFTVSLTQGQVFNVMGQYSGNIGVDLSGSKIQSINTGSGCKRIAVFSGSGRISITCNTTSSSSDNYMVQAFPKTAWGKKYLTVPSVDYNVPNGNTNTQSTPNIYRVNVSDPTTVVRINGIVTSLPLINNFYYEIPATTIPQLIETDKPVVVSQYFPSRFSATAACGLPGPSPGVTINDGDPEVLYLSPVEQNINKVLWNANAQYQINPAKHYINVVIPNTGTSISSFILDGTPVPASSFVVHPQDPAFSYAKLNVSSNAGGPGGGFGLPHIIQSDSGFNAIAYGYGTTESYGYNAGTNIKDIFQYVSVQNQFATVNFPATCRNAPFYFSMTFPYQPTSIQWVFNGLFTDFTMANPATFFTGSIVVAGKTLYQYRIPAPYIIPAAGVYPIKVLATNPTSDGCNGIQEIDYDIQVFNSPVADFTFNNVCFPNSVLFNDNSTTDGRAVTSRNWSFGDATTATTSAPITHAYAAPGLYTVRYSLITDIGCVDTTDHIVNVSPLPTATIAGNAQACVGDSPGPNITFTGFVGQAPFTFTYNINGGPNQTVTTTSGNSVTVPVSTTTAGTVTYNLVSVVDGSPALCTQAQTGSVVVQINQSATATIAGGVSVCKNSPAQIITFTGGGSPGPYTFTYNINGGANQTVTTAAGNSSVTVTAPTTVAGTFIYSVVSVQGSSGACPQTQNVTTTVTITELPTAIVTGTMEACLNAPTAPLITFTGVVGPPPYRFTYNINGGANQTINTTSGNSVTIAVPTNTAGTFTYNLLNVADGSATLCSQAQTGSATVIVNPLPTPNFSISASACVASPITFTDLSVPNAGALNGWNWNFGDATTSSLQNPTHTYAAAGTYTVTLSVTTDKGCTSSTAFTRTVTVSPLPVTDFTVPTICVSDINAPFTDNSTVTPGSLTGWAWNFGDPASGGANTSALQNPTHTFTAPGNYTITLTTTSNSGCQRTATKPMFVNGAAPNTDFNALNPATMCANDSISIQDASTIGFGFVTKVEIYWDNVGTPGVFETDNNPTTGKIYRHKYPNFQTPLTRTYTIRYRAFSGASCVNDRVRTITVNAAPLVQFNNIPASCLDAAPFQITQASEVGGVPGTGVFSGPGVNATGIFNPALVGPGTYNIKYTFTSSAGGCVDTLSKTIQVLDSASARFTITGQACDRSAITFNSSTSTIPAASGTITGWAWTFGDPASGAANISASQNPSHVFSTWGTYNVSLIVTTSNGCRSTVRTTPVVVNPIPRANFTLPASLCLPSANATFNNISTIADGSQGSFTYLWNFGDPGSGASNTATGSSPSHIYTTAGPFNVNLQVTSAAGCMHDTTFVLSNIHPEPTGSFSIDKTDVCIGQSFTFTDNSNPADGTTSQWNWNLADGNTRTTPTFTYTYPTAGVYDVTLFITNSFGCRSSTATRRITVNPYPTVNAGPDLFILEDGSDTLKPIITATNPTYLWTPNLYFVSSNTIMNPVVKGVADITYTITVTGQGDCVASDQVFIKVLKGPEIPNIFSPNGDGIHDKWIIKYLDTYPEGTVEVFNRYGQRIFSSKGYGVPWDGTVDGKPVPMGTYYYIVNPKNGRKLMSGYVDVIR